METEKTTEMTDEQKVEHQLAVRDEAGALSVVEQSAALVVCDIESKERSVEIEKQAKLEKKRDLEFLDPFVTAKHKAWKKFVKTRDDRLLEFDTVIKAEGTKRATWSRAEQDRLAKEAAERAEKEAAERTERLATHKTAIDEAIGTSEDTQATIDILNLMLEQDDMTDEKAEMIRSQIGVHQAVLDGANRAAAEEAAKAELAAQAPPPPPPADLAPKIKGEVEGWAYKATVTDMKALCKSIAEGKVPTAAVKEAQGKLNSYARDGIIKHGECGCHVEKKPTSHTRD